MVNEILAGMAAALHGEFGEEYHVFTEPVEQGVQTPCFLLLSVERRTAPLPSKRRRHRQSFSVQYFPARTDCHGEMRDTAERLELALEEIPYHGGGLRGSGMCWTISDGVLVLQVDYNQFTVQQEENTPMEQLEWKEGI